VALRAVVNQAQPEPYKHVQYFVDVEPLRAYYVYAPCAPGCWGQQGSWLFLCARCGGTDIITKKTAKGDIFCAHFDA